jgi:competence ComEA-like helix-hairpin-helix protein
MKRVFILLLVFFCFTISRVFAAGTVDINTASLAQLDTLTGIGPVYAQRIVDGRPYSSIDDLDRVKGIGPATLQKIKDQGLAYVSGQVQQPTQTATTPQTTITEPIVATNESAKDTSIVYPAGVVINEILPNPEGADETNEWIELYNSNSSDIDLSGWQLQDTNGTITTYTIAQGTKILANSFLIFKRPDTKISLNNDQDGLNLLTPDKKIADSVAFTTAPLNQSYNKTSTDWLWSTTLTPGAKNIISAITAVPKAVAGTKTLSKANNSVKNNGVASGLADISQSININQDNKTQNPWFLFFTVLAITIILAVIVLFIKLTFLKNHVRT